MRCFDALITRKMLWSRLWCFDLAWNALIHNWPINSGGKSNVVANTTRVIQIWSIFQPTHKNLYELKTSQVTIKGNPWELFISVERKALLIFEEQYLHNIAYYKCILQVKKTLPIFKDSQPDVYEFNINIWRILGTWLE